MKVHAAMEVDRFFVLSYTLTGSELHENQRFGEVSEPLY